MGTKVYFFKNNTYGRYDRADRSLDDGYPKPIAGNWPGMDTAGFADRIDAAVNWGNGKVYFFRDNQYVKYNMNPPAPEGVEAGYPKPIAGNWPGMDTAGFADRIDAAVNWGNGKVYFFRDNQYVKYNMNPPAPEGVEAGYPKPIAGNWPGMDTAGFADRIDAAVNWGNGKVYFFLGDQYLQL